MERCSILTAAALIEAGVALPSGCNSTSVRVCCLQGFSTALALVDTPGADARHRLADTYVISTSGDGPNVPWETSRDLILSGLLPPRWPLSGRTHALMTPP